MTEPKPKSKRRECITKEEGYTLVKIKRETHLKVRGLSLFSERRQRPQDILTELVEYALKHYPKDLRDFSKKKDE